MRWIFGEASLRFKTIGEIAMVSALAFALAGPASAGPGNPNKTAALTAWWVIFNDTDACEHPTMNSNGDELGLCGAEDIAGGEGVNEGVCIVHATGAPADKWRATLVSTLLRSNVEDDVACEFGSSGGLTEPMDAEIHLVLRLHADSPKKNQDQTVLEE